MLKEAKRSVNLEMAEEQIHSEKQVEKKEDVCLLEELHSSEPVENIEEKGEEGIIRVVAEEARGSERNPDAILIPCTSLDSFGISTSTDTSCDKNDMEYEECQSYQTNSSISLKEQQPQEPIEKKQDGCSVLELQLKEPIENVEERGEQEVTEGVVAEERWVTHYSSFQKILLVGEADFSFSASLAMAFGSASNMIATSIESKATLKKIYERVKTNIKNLTCRGCRVLHGVDATKMATEGPLKAMLFDRIIFNFPLAGFSPKETPASQLRLQKKLVTLFLENAREMISETGEIHVTYKSNVLHCEWDMEQLASGHGLRLIEALQFNSTDYPGYSTKGWFGGDDSLDCYPCHTYKFGLKNAKIASTKRRRGRKKNNSMAIGKRLDADLLKELHFEESIEHVEEREHEVISGMVAEEERGSDRSHIGVSIPRTVSESFTNSRSADKSRDQNGVEFEEHKEHQNHSSKLQQEVIVSSDCFLSGLPEEEHSQEPNEKRQELHSEEQDENTKEREQDVIKGEVAEERWLNHYNMFQKILLVGEADFSFSASLATAFGSASNMIATSLESKAFVRKNYESAKTNIKNLTKRGCKVMHVVDATKMASKGLLKGMTFDRIIFNFPLAGFFPNERCESELRRHQRLVILFLKNAKKMINETGEIHITHKTNGFLAEGNIEQLASSLGLKLIEALHFNCLDYPGYNTTGLAGGDGNLDSNLIQIYKFGLENANNTSRERRRKKKKLELIGERQNANFEEREHEVISGTITEEEKGISRDGVLHDQNDIEFEECEDYRNCSSTSSLLQQEVFVSSDGYLSCEDPISYDTLQQETETCCLLELNSEEAFENERDSCFVKELQFEGQIPKEEGACFLDGIRSKEPFENVEEREPAVIKSVVVEERWINHYSSLQKILLVGEGDFSFSASLACAFGSASNMIATSLNSKVFLMKHYGCVEKNINNLTTRGCKVLHGVDATKMASNRLFKGMTFDRIIFNFPFAGFFPKEDDETQLRRHQELVSLFLENAKNMIKETGEIHITHKTSGLQRKWTIEQLASAQGLRLIEASCFRKADYPGYRTKYGFGGDKDFDCNPSKTYKFGLQDASKINGKEKKKMKKNVKKGKNEKRGKKEKEEKNDKKGKKEEKKNDKKGKMEKKTVKKGEII